MIQSAFRTMILSDSEVSHLINDRVYDIMTVKDAVFPCITLQRISETIDTVTFARRTVIQTDCYSEKHITAIELAETVLKAVTNKTGTRTIEGELIFSVQPLNITDLSVPETRIFRVSCDYAVVWRFP